MPGILAWAAENILGGGGAAAPERPETSGEPIFAASGKLYAMNGPNTYNEVPGTGPLTIRLLKGTDQKGALKVTMEIVGTDSGEEFYAQNLNESGALEYFKPTVMWPATVKGKIRRFAFQFGEGAPFESPGDACMTFVDRYNTAVYAVLENNPETLSAVDDDDVAFAASAFSANVSTVEDEPEPEPRPPVDGPAPTTIRSVVRATSVERTGAGADDYMTDATAHERLLVCKPGNLYESVCYNEAGVAAPVTQQIQGDVVTTSQPKDVVLTHGQNKAVLLPNAQASGVLEFDLATGQATEYLPGVEDKLSSLSLANGKDGSINPHILVVGGAHSRFTIDTRRDPKKCAVVEDVDFRHAALKSQTFSCHATTKEGHLVVGDMVGQLRLLTGAPGAAKTKGSGRHTKIAKTLIKATGVPIRSVDVTEDGKYVLARCDTQLLVVNTQMADDAGAPVSGFVKRMGQKKPLPLRLNPPAELLASPESESYTFVSSYFSVEGDSINAGFGPYVLMWSLKAVEVAAARHGTIECATREAPGRLRLVSAASSTSNNTNHLAFMTEKAVGVEYFRPGRDLPRSGRFTARFS